MRRSTTEPAPSATRAAKASTDDGRRPRQDLGVFFTLPDWAVALIIICIIVGASLAGAAFGAFLRAHSEALREPFGVVQGAILGVVGLILAFGLTLAIGRYEQRRAAVA